MARPPTGGRPRKTTRTKAEGCHDQARCVLWECPAAPHVTTGSLPTFSSTVETGPSLAWLSELAPSSFIAGRSDVSSGFWEEAPLPYLLGRSQKSANGTWESLSPLVPTITNSSSKSPRSHVFTLSCGPDIMPGAWF